MSFSVKGLGKLRWPWKAVTVTPAERPPLIVLNRYPGQIIGIAFRLPSEPVHDRVHHKQLSILWARPDVKQYPPDWETRPGQRRGASMSTNLYREDS